MWKGRKRRTENPELEREQNCPGQVLFAAIQSALDNLELKAVNAKQNNNKKKEARRWNVLEADKLPWELSKIPEQKPTEAIWYIKKVWYFCIQCLLFHFCGGLQQGTNICISFDFYPKTFLSLWVWIMFALFPLWYCWTTEKNRKKKMCVKIL